ncbi:hypothetical protein [Mesorhizobium sp. INR15]|uniref:hypothetical protein n=1 Tax=Mesorhizobium sp. INR15 TaxID=2654248 RepID=UPI00189651ED|nr:hypothetical protein [Mesorhizobium sp. INR15]QPC90313.1 hypothetical protein GA829_06750 [Mesorhizobium sp. INR15]
MNAHPLTMTERLEALSALPKLWRVTSIFSDGVVRTLDQPLQASAENYANRKREFLGKVVADGVRLVSVTVNRI